MFGFKFKEPEPPPNEGVYVLASPQGDVRVGRSDNLKSRIRVQRGYQAIQVIHEGDWKKQKQLERRVARFYRHQALEEDFDVKNGDHKL